MPKIIDCLIETLEYVGIHSVCFCFTLTVLFMHTMLAYKTTIFNKSYRTYYKI